MKTKFLFLYLLFCGLAWAHGTRTEIEALLNYVEKLDGATFIRNGTEHSPKDAARHMRMKWERQKADISSSEDFIRLCASKSSLSGKRYIVRQGNASERFCDELLLEELNKIREEQKRQSGPLGEAENPAANGLN